MDFGSKHGLSIVRALRVSYPSSLSLYFWGKKLSPKKTLSNNSLKKLSPIILYYNSPSLNNWYIIFPLAIFLRRLFSPPFFAPVFSWRKPAALHLPSCTLCQAALHLPSSPAMHGRLAEFTVFGWSRLYSIYFSHSSSSSLQLQLAEQYFSLTALQLQPPAPACRTQPLRLGIS